MAIEVASAKSFVKHVDDHASIILCASNLFLVEELEAPSHESPITTQELPCLAHQGPTHPRCAKSQDPDLVDIVLGHASAKDSRRRDDVSAAVGSGRVLAFRLLPPARLSTYNHGVELVFIGP